MSWYFRIGTNFAVGKRGETMTSSSYPLLKNTVKKRHTLDALIKNVT